MTVLQAGEPGREDASPVLSRTFDLFLGSAVIFSRTQAASDTSGLDKVVAPVTLTCLGARRSRVH